MFAVGSSVQCDDYVAVALHDTFEGNDYVVEFDFLGKDSIRYQNHVPVEKQVCDTCIFVVALLQLPVSNQPLCDRFAAWLLRDSGR